MGIECKLSMEVSLSETIGITFLSTEFKHSGVRVELWVNRGVNSDRERELTAIPGTQTMREKVQIPANTNTGKAFIRVHL